jgi:hypothetical protein
MKPSSTHPHTIALHTIEIPSPCTASWETMQGNDQVRHCGLCKKNVFNLSAMPEAEAAALVAGNTDGNLCVRFYRRSDGTVMTSDCGGARTPARMARRRLAGVAGAAGAAMLAMAAHGAPDAAPTGQHVDKHAVQKPAPMLMGAPMATPRPVDPRDRPAPFTPAPSLGEAVFPVDPVKGAPAEKADAEGADKRR